MHVPALACPRMYLSLHAHACPCPLAPSVQARVDAVKTQLLSEGLELEDFGGPVQVGVEQFRSNP